jgi:hypothetical protein
MIISELTLDDFQRIGWQEAVANCDKKTCDYYSIVFREKAADFQLLKDFNASEAFVLLSDVTSMMMRLDTPNLFTPCMIMQNSRSAKVEDFSEEVLAVFSALLQDIKDPEIKARLADVIWIRQRKHQMARLAVDSYLESARRLEHPENWTYNIDRIERALQLAAQIEKGGELFINAVRYIEEILDRYKGTDPLFFSAKLMEILQKYRQGDSEKYALLALKIASDAEIKGQWFKAREYWLVKSKWHIKKEEITDKHDALTRYAMTFVHEAELKSSAMEAASLIQEAIEVMRNIPNTKQDQETLFEKMLDYQQKSISEFVEFSYPFDIDEEIIQKVVSHVSNKSIIDTLLSLALITKPSNIVFLREQVIQSANQYIFTGLTAHNICNQRGRIIGYKPAVLTFNEKESETAIRSEMFSTSRRYQISTVLTTIEPAIQQINREHNVRIADFIPIIANNPFVPPDRISIYAKGFYAGITGDFLTASHLLIPQIEHSIRYLLERNGMIVSVMDTDGIQKERDLNVILYGEYGKTLKKIFDNEDLLFALRGILVERCGSNFRNLMAHGLISENELYSEISVYLWWLTLHICVLAKFCFMKYKHSTNEVIDELVKKIQALSPEENSLLIQKLNERH